jgi:hypothetical protein
MKPNIQVDDVVREMTDEEFADWQLVTSNERPLDVVGDNPDVQHEA